MCPTILDQNQPNKNLAHHLLGQQAKNIYLGKIFELWGRQPDQHLHCNTSKTLAPSEVPRPTALLSLDQLSNWQVKSNQE